MTLEHELFESFASEVGSFFIEAVYAASLFQIVLTCISIICIAWHFWPTFYPYDEFPRIHRPILQLLPWYGKSVAEALKEGWEDVLQKGGDGFVMRLWAQDFLILHPRYKADVDSANEGKLSFMKSIGDSLDLQASCGGLVDSPNRMIRVADRLNGNLGELMPQIAQETDDALRPLFKVENPNAQYFSTSSLASSLAHRVTCRFLTTNELSRDPDFLAKSNRFISSIFWNAYVIKTLPLGPFRELLTWPISYFHRRNLDAAVHLLQPAVEHRISERQAAKEHINGHDTCPIGKSNGALSPVSHLDAIEWSLSAYEPDNAKTDSRQLSLELLHNLWIGTVPTGFLLANALYELLSRPEYIELLRVEVDGVVGKLGWSEEALEQMPLLDKFIKHVGTIYPFSSISCPRTIVGTSMWRLHDGLVLPPDTRIAFPSEQITRKRESGQDLFNPKLATLGDAAGAETDMETCSKANNTKDINGTPDQEIPSPKYPRNTPDEVEHEANMFGIGPHSCPSRKFGLAVVKVVLAKLVLGYDLELESQGKSSRRPFAAVEYEGFNFPDEGGRVRMRRRRRR